MSRNIAYNINPDVNVQTGADKTYFPVMGWSLYQKKVKIQVPDPTDPTKLTEKEVLEIETQTLDDLKTRGFYLRPDNKHFVFKYPQEFVTPSNVEKDKYIIFQYCRATYEGHMTGEIEVHADFVPRDTYCDSLVYQANLQVPDDNRKYKVTGNRKQGFEVWFTDGKGDRSHVIVPDDFTMYLKLVY